MLLKKVLVKEHLRSLLPFLFAASLFTVHCAGARVVEPLKEGTHQVSFDLGGPFLDLFGASFPLPMSSLNYAYGITGDLSAFGSLYTTAALFGVIQIEAGVLYGILANQGWVPGISIKPSVQFMIDTFEWNPRVYPVLDAQVYWKLREGQDVIYLGMGNWFELNATRAYGQPQPQNWIPYFYLGYILGLSEWHIFAELQYLAPNVSNQNLAVTYSFLPDFGALGLHLGFGRSF